MLPSTISRVIYLDQDVLVKKDLADLWDMDLEGHPIAAARESWIFLECREENISAFQEVKLLTHDLFLLLQVFAELPRW